MTRPWHALALATVLVGTAGCATSVFAASAGTTSIASTARTTLPSANTNTNTASTPFSAAATPTAASPCNSDWAGSFTTNAGGPATPLLAAQAWARTAQRNAMNAHAWTARWTVSSQDATDASAHSGRTTLHLKDQGHGWFVDSGEIVGVVCSQG
jgi:hypothetical protein